MPDPNAFPLGVTLTDTGVNVAVYSETADDILFCTFDDAGAETRHRLTRRFGHTFYDHIDGVGVGARYGLRALGRWNLHHGLRHNGNKLLLDPYARAVTGDPAWGQALFSHRFDNPREHDDTDSAAAMPKGIIVDTAFDWEGDTPPRTPFDRTIIYEAHVKGFTKLLDAVPEDIRGTYLGLAHPAAIGYLTELGVTAVELQPVHQFFHESHLLEKGLRNYWGYNSIGFFAPHGDYSSTGDTGGQVAEFKQMVKALHRAGIEVILDVVYNHTAEGNHQGPTLSYKGIDNPSYYRLVDEDKSSYYDTTGTGNSLNVTGPAGLAMIMDSLRYWVTDMHVDGFRFDLATTLTRQGGRESNPSAFLNMVEQDPILKPIKLIAEPWDTAGYQVGGFPASWGEWNGKYRDDVRSFWHGADSVLGTTSQRILGSPDIYESGRRMTFSSINFVTAHDGFTLADLTAYNDKHNSDNGENNQDCESDNHSSNAGAEGPTDSPAVNERRDRQRRNFLATLLLSTGVPMLLAGDEIARTQNGNNNAYCQDNEVSWIDWDNADHHLLAFTQHLIQLRRTHPALRPAFHRHAAGSDHPDTVSIYRADGNPFTDQDWANPRARAIGFTFHHTGADSFTLLLNSAENGVQFTVPAPPHGPWELVASSDPGQIVEPPTTTLIVRDTSFTLLQSPNLDQS